MKHTIWKRSLLINLTIATVLLLALLAGSAMAEGAETMDAGGDAADGQAG